MVNEGHVPVVATVAEDIDSTTIAGQVSGANGGEHLVSTDQTIGLNVNADTAAGSIASAMNAEKLILMTDVPGIMRDSKDADSLVRETTVVGANQLIKDKIVQGGMIPKVQCCVSAIANGVKAAHIIDGREPHSLLMEILTDIGCGTKIDS